MGATLNAMIANPTSSARLADRAIGAHPSFGGSGLSSTEVATEYTAIIAAKAAGTSARTQRSSVRILRMLGKPGSSPRRLRAAQSVYPMNQAWSTSVKGSQSHCNQLTRVRGSNPLTGLERTEGAKQKSTSRHRQGT